MEEVQEYFQNFKDQRISILKMDNSSWLGTVLFIGISCLISSSIKVLVIRYIWVQAPKSRPLNIICLIDQVFKSCEPEDIQTTLMYLHFQSVQLILSLIFMGLTFASVAKRLSLVELFGGSTKVCKVYVASFMLYNGFNVVSSSGMAVYRLFCIKLNVSLWEKHGQFKVKEY